MIPPLRASEVVLLFWVGFGGLDGYIENMRLLIIGAL
jgi:hypothetical protein